MKGKHTKKLIAALMGVAMGASYVPAMAPATVSAESAGVEGTVVYSTDFEDGDVSMFANRGGGDTTVISVTDEASVSGDKALLASGRTKDWNGPAFQLDNGVLKPYTEYSISFKMKGRYYTGGMVSMQYTDLDGKEHYSNLVQNISSSDWVSIDDLRVSFHDMQSKVKIYVEGGQDDIFIDDFKVVELKTPEIEKDLVSISDAFAKDFKVGTAITVGDLSSKPFMALLEKHFNQSITVGNEMKPDAVLDKEASQAYVEETGDDTVPQISFSTAKPILNYCQKNKIPVRIHTLVWHSQTPNWFFKEGFADDGEWVDEEKMLLRMENYIKAYFETLIELYPDVDFYACDVVNEAWMEDGKPRQPGEQGPGTYSSSAWVKVFGDNSFIEPAFTFARKYAPKDCKLYYNDYNEYMDGKMNAIIEMATDLKSKGLIDGIGMQSHLDARQSLDAAFPSVAMYNKALDKYAELGLDIQITELDATTPENAPTDANFDVQADYYKGIFDAIYAHKDSISAVIWWGITDDKSWRASQYPLLFDAEYKAKDAYYSIMEGVEAPPVVDEPDPEPEPADVDYGDANCDGNVTLADAVLIMQVLGNPDAYGVDGTGDIHISEQGMLNGDVANVGDGLTNADALAVQEYLLKLIDKLPKE